MTSPVRGVFLPIFDKRQNKKGNICILNEDHYAINGVPMRAQLPPLNKKSSEFSHSDEFLQSK